MLLADTTEAQQKIVFEEILDEKLAFSQKWIVWEHYDTEDYQKSMRQIAWFHDVLSFAEAWRNIPHSEVKNFFYNE